MPTTLNETDRREFRSALLRGVQRAVAGDPGVTIDGTPVPEFLAGPTPGNPFSAFQQRAGRATCDRWARNNRSSLLPRQDVYLRQLCEPYLGANMPGNPSTGNEFPGGQCPVRYSLSVVWSSKTGTNCTVNQGNTFNFTCSGGTINNQVFGPISGYESIPQSTGTQHILRLICRDSTGAPATRQFAANVCPGTESVSITNVTRCDGLADNCGDPSEVYDAGAPNPSPDPNPGPVGGPTGFPFPDLDITVNPDGTIEVDFGDGEQPEIIDPGAESTGNGELAPGDIGEAAEPEETGEDGEASACAPEGQVLGAIKLTIITAPPNAKLFAPGVFRGACYVYIGTLEGYDHDPAGAMVVDNQLVFPEKDNLTCWKVVANAGYNISVTPFYLEGK